MKPSKKLARVFLGSYFIWAFGALLFWLLLIKDGGALPIIIFVLACLDLAGIIVARVMYGKQYKVFFILSVISFFLLNVFVVGGFVTEAIYTSKGIPAVYAWVFASVNLALVALMDYHYIRDLITSYHKNMVAHGLIEEKEEEI